MMMAIAARPSGVIHAATGGLLLVDGQYCRHQVPPSCVGYLILLMALLGLQSLAYAVGGEAHSRLSLRGLQGVQVRVGDLAPEIGQDGLRKVQLHANVTLQLRKAGIKVLSLEEFRSHPRQPTLYIEIATVKASKQKAYAINVRAELQQIAFLDHTPPILTIVSTWGAGLVGLVEVKGRAQIVRKTITALVDEFIRDYRAINAVPLLEEDEEQEA